MASVAETMRDLLAQTLAPERLDIIDESHRHIGHAGARPGGETHFRLAIVSPRFDGLTRVARHRLVYEALGDMVGARVHALQIEAHTPQEASRETKPTVKR